MYDDFLAKVLEPDSVLPAQFYGEKGLPRQLEGEKRLMLAILKDALECLDKYREAKTSSSRDLYHNALQWIQDKGTDWLFTFANICDLLGIDPDYLREFLLKREHGTPEPTKGSVLSFSSSSGR
jgi:hypothetical protein